MNIYQILDNGYLGAITEVPDGTPAIPAGNTRTAPPAIPPGQYAFWQGTGWGLTQTPPPAPLPPAPPRVTEVTMRQARLALLGAGLLDQVDAAIAAIPDAVQRRAAQIEWEYAAVVERDSPLIQQMAPALGMADAQMDALFAAAAAL